MPNTKKKLLIVQTNAPFGTSKIQESLDIVLAAGTFDQDVRLLIEDDACYQLLPNQQSNSIDQKNTRKMLTALPIYGIDKLFVCKESVEARHITANSSFDNIDFVCKDDIKTLYREADTVIRF